MNTKSKIILWITWILIFSLGIGLLFLGFKKTLGSEELPLAVMFMMMGIILLFLSLSIILRRFISIKKEI